MPHQFVCDFVSPARQKCANTGSYCFAFLFWYPIILRYVSRGDGSLKCRHRYGSTLFSRIRKWTCLGWQWDLKSYSISILPLHGDGYHRVVLAPCFFFNQNQALSIYTRENPLCIELLFTISIVCGSDIYTEGGSLVHSPAHTIFEFKSLLLFSFRISRDLTRCDNGLAHAFICVYIYIYSHRRGREKDVRLLDYI